MTFEAGSQSDGISPDGGCYLTRPNQVALSNYCHKSPGWSLTAYLRVNGMLRASLYVNLPLYVHVLHLLYRESSHYITLQLT